MTQIRGQALVPAGDPRLPISVDIYRRQEFEATVLTDATGNWVLDVGETSGGYRVRRVYYQQRYDATAS